MEEEFRIQNSENRKQKTEFRRQKKREYRNLTTDFADCTDLRKRIEQKIAKETKNKIEEM